MEFKVLINKTTIVGVAIDEQAFIKTQVSRLEAAGLKPSDLYDEIDTLMEEEALNRPGGPDVDPLADKVLASAWKIAHDVNTMGFGLQVATMIAVLGRDEVAMRIAQLAPGPQFAMAG